MRLLRGYDAGMAETEPLTGGWEYDPTRFYWHWRIRRGDEIVREVGSIAAEFIVDASNAGYRGAARAAEMGVMDPWEHFQCYVKERFGTALPAEARPSPPAVTVPSRPSPGAAAS